MKTSVILSAIVAAVFGFGGIAAGAAARRDWLKPRFQIAVMQNRIEAIYRQILAAKPAARA